MLKHEYKIVSAESVEKLAVEVNKYTGSALLGGPFTFGLITVEDGDGKSSYGAIHQALVIPTEVPDEPHVELATEGQIP